jgi:DNA polymerase-3 subunit epsilon
LTLTKRQRKVAAWARERVADPSTVFLDTETTGIGAGAEIIELAVVDLDGNALIDTLVAPVAAIPAESTRIHGLVDADVAGAPSWGDVYPLLAPLLRERPVVVYNAEFDRRMIERCCTARGLTMESGEWHCAMRSYATWAGVRSSRHRRRFRLYALGDALAAFDLPAGNHRALGDALACRSLVIALAGDEGLSSES